MPSIQAFRGLRYDLGHVGALSDVIAPPYDVIDEQLQDDLYAKSDYNCVRLILNKMLPTDDEANNRYTRALYGSHTDWRLETSDRPVFAVAKKNHHRNIRLVVNGVPLDATDFCRAAYEDGMRSYVLRDQRWGSGTLCVKVVSLYDEEVQSAKKVLDYSDREDLSM